MEKTRENRVLNAKERIKKAYLEDREENMQEDIRFIGLIDNLAALEVDLEIVEEAKEKSGGAVLVHPKTGAQKPNPLNVELIRMRANYISLLQTLQKYLGVQEEEEDEGMSEFI